MQIRAHADPVPAVARVVPIKAGSSAETSASHGTGATTELVIVPAEPLTGVAPGQTAVVYLGTRVLGQCTIDRTVSAVDTAADTAVHTAETSALDVPVAVDA